MSMCPQRHWGLWELIIFPDERRHPLAGRPPATLSLSGAWFKTARPCRQWCLGWGGRSVGTHMLSLLGELGVARAQRRHRCHSALSASHLHFSLFASVLEIRGCLTNKFYLCDLNSAFLQQRPVLPQRPRNKDQQVVGGYLVDVIN